MRVPCPLIRIVASGAVRPRLPEDVQGALQGRGNKLLVSPFEFLFRHRLLIPRVQAPLSLVSLPPKVARAAGACYCDQGGRIGVYTLKRFSEYGIRWQVSYYKLENVYIL